MIPGLQIWAGKPKQSKTKFQKDFGKREFEKHLLEKTYLYE